MILQKLFARSANKNAQSEPISAYLKNVLKPWRSVEAETATTLRRLYESCESAFANTQNAIRTGDVPSSFKQAANRINEYAIIMMLCNLPAVDTVMPPITDLQNILSNTIKLVIGMVDEGTIGCRLNTELIRMYDLLPKHKVAVSHVWGFDGKLVSEEEKNSNLNHHRVLDEASCGSGWIIGARFVKKFMAFLGDTIWMDTFNVPQCCKKHKSPYISEMYTNYILADTTVAVTENPLDVRSLKEAFKKLIEEGWFNRAWTVQELGIGRDVLLVHYTEDGMRQCTRMFDTIHMLLLESAKFTESVPHTIPREKLFWSAYSYRAIRAAVFNLDPAQNMVALVQGRSAFYNVDLIYSLANLCGVSLLTEYETNETVEECWIRFAKAAARRQPYLGFYLTACVPSSVDGYSAVPDIGFDVQPIWPRGRRMRILSSLQHGLHIGSWAMPAILNSEKLQLSFEGNEPVDVKNRINRLAEIEFSPFVLRAISYASWIGKCIDDLQTLPKSRWQRQTFRAYMAESISKQAVSIVLAGSDDINFSSVHVALVLADEKSELKVYTCALLQKCGSEFKFIGHVWHFCTNVLTGEPKEYTLV